jgi:hypothetical protein
VRCAESKALSACVHSQAPQYHSAPGSTPMPESCTWKRSQRVNGGHGERGEHGEAGSSSDSSDSETGVCAAANTGASSVTLTPR